MPIDKRITDAMAVLKDKLPPCDDIMLVHKDDIKIKANDMLMDDELIIIMDTAKTFGMKVYMMPVSNSEIEIIMHL